jgi:ADP-heptose:LPS heptosyltransferase
MKLTAVPAPVIWAAKAQAEKAAALIPAGGPVLGIGPTANWIGKTWAQENFIELVRRLTAPGGILPGARVAVFAAPGEEENACKVLSSVPEARRIDVIAKADPGTAAAALSRCAFYVGNDSGLMHCAAAAGTPTVGLFGPSWPHLYRPWGAHTTFVTTPQNFAELTDFPGYDPKTLDRSLMAGLTVNMVEEAINKEFRGRDFARKTAR